jgi:hypothetical protein
MTRWSTTRTRYRAPSSFTAGIVAELPCTIRQPLSQPPYKHIRIQVNAHAVVQSQNGTGPALPAAAGTVAEPLEEGSAWKAYRLDVHCLLVYLNRVVRRRRVPADSGTSLWTSFTAAPRGDRRQLARRAATKRQRPTSARDAEPLEFAKSNCNQGHCRTVRAGVLPVSRCFHLNGSSGGRAAGIVRTVETAARSRMPYTAKPTAANSEQAPNATTLLIHRLSKSASNQPLPRIRSAIERSTLVGRSATPMRFVQWATNGACLSNKQDRITRSPTGRPLRRDTAIAVLCARDGNLTSGLLWITSFRLVAAALTRSTTSSRFASRAIARSTAAPSTSDR